MTAFEITVAEDGLGHWAYEFQLDGRRYESVGQRLYSEKAARRNAERNLTELVKMKRSAVTYSFDVPDPPAAITYDFEVAE